MLKRLAKKILRTAGLATIGDLKRTAVEHERRIAEVQNRARNRRFAAIEELADYLVGAEVPGDYCEFGVYKGATFAYACQNLSIFPQMRFFAFDSFEGLPQPKGLDAAQGYTSNFHRGEFACSEQDFVKNVEASGADMRRVVVVKGWFDETLTDQRAKDWNLSAVAGAWIDCDLYESTVPILNFLTKRLAVGSVVLFDDWRCFRNLPDYGEQKACREWLERNPQIRLRELFSFGWHGCAFTVASS